MWQLRTAAVSEWSWKAPAYLRADTGTWQWWGSAAFLAGHRSRTGATSSAVGGTTTWQPKGWIWAEWEDFNARICAFPERTISSGVTPRWQRGFLQDLPSIYYIVHVSVCPEPWELRATRNNSKAASHTEEPAQWLIPDLHTEHKQGNTLCFVHARNGLAYTLHPNLAPQVLWRLNTSGVEP